MISIQVSCPPTLRFELSIELCTFHITKNNMAQENEGKCLENRLKKVALACAYTLTSPTAFEPDEPYLHQRGESLEEKVRRVRQEGRVYDYGDTSDDTGEGNAKT